MHHEVGPDGAFGIPILGEVDVIGVSDGGFP